MIELKKIGEGSTNIREGLTTNNQRVKEGMELDRKLKCFSHNLEWQSTNTCSAYSVKQHSYDRQLKK